MVRHGIYDALHAWCANEARTFVAKQKTPPKRGRCKSKIRSQPCLRRAVKPTTAKAAAIKESVAGSGTLGLKAWISDTA